MDPQSRLQQSVINVSNDLKEEVKARVSLEDLVIKQGDEIKGLTITIDALSNTIDELIKAKDELVNVIEEMNTKSYKRSSIIDRWRRKLRLGRIK